MREEDPIDALSALNPVPDDAEVEIPEGLEAIPDSMRRSTSARVFTVAVVLAGLMVGWTLVSATWIPQEAPPSGCVVVSGRVVSSSAGVCVADLAP